MRWHCEEGSTERKKARRRGEGKGWRGSERGREREGMGAIEKSEIGRDE